MKKLLIYCVMAFFAVSLGTSCKKDGKDLNLDVNTVSTLSLPANQLAVKLTPSVDIASVLFKWNPTTAADGNPVMYEVAFYKENGDMTQPIYRMVSDGGGIQTQLTISHKILTKVAALAGIQSLNKGNVKWAVLTSRVANVKISNEVRTINLERPAGFAELPTALYLTGSATENGADLAKAHPFKKIDEGVFEIYTSIKAGTYKLTDKNAAGGKEFYIDGTSLKEGATGVTVTGDTKVYRIILDFNLATVTMKPIGDIMVYMAGINATIGTLTYQGASTWRVNSMFVDFVQFSWGRDERYKFKVQSTAGDEWFGSSLIDNQSPTGKPASYFFLLPKSNSQWDNTYKFDPSADKKNVRVEVFFKADAAYTHQVTVIN